MAFVPRAKLKVPRVPLVIREDSRGLQLPQFRVKALEILILIHLHQLHSPIGHLFKSIITLLMFSK